MQPARPLARPDRPLLALALAQWAATLLAPGLGLGVSIADRARALETPVLPAPWAFAIWAVIYTGCIAVALAGGVFGPRGTVASRARSPLAVAMAANAAWAVWVQLVGFDAVSLGIILAMLAALLVALARLAALPAGASRGQRLLLRPLVGVFAGWISVASAANVATMLASLGVTVTPALAIAHVVAAGALVAAMTFRGRGNAGYSAAAVWGLAGIAAADLAAPGRAAVGEAAIGLAALLALALAAARAAPAPFRFREHERPIE
jgi:hypothetical protein